MSTGSYNTDFIPSGLPAGWNITVTNADFVPSGLPAGWNITVVNGDETGPIPTLSEKSRLELQEASEKYQKKVACGELTNAAL